MVPYFRPWLDAWVESAYGDDGFWRTARPADHFRTASSSPQLVEPILALLREHPRVSRVVELGAGDGLLLNHLHERRADLTLSGVDLRSRPPGLASGVSWAQDLWDVTAGSWSDGAARTLLEAVGEPALVLAVEWLDDLPADVVWRGSSGVHTVKVEPSGNERLGERVEGSDREWLERWWPVQGRAEVGLTRDRAWGSVLSSLSGPGGLGLVVDYGHRRATRPPGGSLTAYRTGRQVEPMPRSDRNLTAAVAIDALAEAGHRVGAVTLRCARQRELLATRPAREDDDPLAALVSRCEHAALASPSGWGDQWWLLQQLTAHEG